MQDRQLTFSDAAAEWLVARSWPGNDRELRRVIDHAVIAIRGIATRGNCIEVEDLTVTEPSVSQLPPEVASDLAKEVRRWTLDHLDRLSQLGQRIHGSHSDDNFGTMYEDFLSIVEPPMRRRCAARA